METSLGLAWAPKAPSGLKSLKTGPELEAHLPRSRASAGVRWDREPL